MTTVHENQKRFTCDVCGDKFGSNSGLKSHKKCKHDGMKDHKCDQCEKVFSLRKLLLSHMRNIHVTESKREVCSYCGKTFRNKKYLN